VFPASIASTLGTHTASIAMGRYVFPPSTLGYARRGRRHGAESAPDSVQGVLGGRLLRLRQPRRLRRRRHRRHRCGLSSVGGAWLTCDAASTCASAKVVYPSAALFIRTMPAPPYAATVCPCSTCSLMERLSHSSTAPPCPSPRPPPARCSHGPPGRRAAAGCIPCTLEISLLLLLNCC
jgi:hypothetical protein